MPQSKTTRLRGRPRKRDVAIRAADSVRKGRFKSVSDAAFAFVQEHFGRGQFQDLSEREIRESDAFRQFREYIFEELENGAQTLMIRFRVLGKRKFNRRKQKHEPEPGVDILKQIREQAELLGRHQQDLEFLRVQRLELELSRHALCGLRAAADQINLCRHIYSPLI